MTKFGVVKMAVNFQKLSLPAGTHVTRTGDKLGLLKIMSEGWYCIRCSTGIEKQKLGQMATGISLTIGKLTNSLPLASLLKNQIKTSVVG